MAIHRVGDRYLSDAEYAFENALEWMVVVFFSVAGGLGFALWQWVVDPAWPKAVRFLCVVILPVAVACWAVRYAFAIRVVLMMASVLAIIGSLLAGAWLAL